MKRLTLLLLIVASCSDDDRGRAAGQTSFESVPLGYQDQFGETNGVDTPGAAGGGAEPATPTASRTVQETDLYRLDGNRLYYLNSYRGLMVFDVTNPDQPALLGRSPIFGDPVDMVVNNGIAIVVVGDWYGTLDDGSPFHGSVVRGLDATDPTNIKLLGDARLGGWVQDDRVVGNVIYAVSQDYGWTYGWNNGVSSETEQVIVSSVSFANNTITAVGNVELPGYSGIFNVTPNSIMLAHATSNDTSELLYLDISDPNGAIVQRGSMTVRGDVEGWGADNGRWNLDFADGVTAHVIGQSYSDYQQPDYVLTTVDFSQPDSPVLVSDLAIPSTNYSVAARFDTGRLYLSPDSDYDDGTDTTPFQVYDLTNPAAPFLAGTVTIPGTVWNILPAPSSRLFALGDDWGESSTGDTVSLKYLDVTNPAAPQLLSTATFGQGWAWTPAAGTFKAFTMDSTRGLVVLPYSGWDDDTEAYNNGLQLIEFSAQNATTAGPAHTKGWVERGIFVGTRLVSLSDLSLAVVDYSDPMSPSVVTELTLARNVITAQPTGSTIAEVSSDWFDNDVTSSEVRVLPIASADETTDVGAVPTVTVPGIGAQVFTNGALSYIVTDVQTQAPCITSAETCTMRAQHVEVVDLSNGTAVARGTISLPADPWGWYGWGWFGFLWNDWYEGAEVVQVGGNALAFRRWEPVLDQNGNYIATNSLLYVVDLSNPDAPAIASVTIQPDRTAWWGNMRVVGDTLYTTHYEWIDHPNNDGGWVRYYIDGIDLSDRTHPRIGHRINVPGVLVGGDDNDPSLLYTIDYQWNGTTFTNSFDAVRISGNTATLLSWIPMNGWVGSTFVRGTQAYMTLQRYVGADNDTPVFELHAIDLTNPSDPRDSVANGQLGWGWLMDVEGDRALVTSGWGVDGLDIYQLTQGQPPQYRQTVRSRGWWVNGASRQGQSLFLSSGYWGVQTIQLQ